MTKIEQYTPELRPKFKKPFDRADAVTIGRLSCGISQDSDLGVGEGADSGREGIRQEDIAALECVGISFEEGFKPRGVLFSSEDFQGGAESIIGSPLYIVEGKFDTPLVRRHEIGHAFINSHLVPEQPTVPILWDSIIDEEVLALPGQEYVGDSLANSLYQVAKRLRRDYSRNPLEALTELARTIEDKRSNNRTVIAYALEEGDGLNFETAHFEAIYASVNQFVVNELRKSTALTYRVAKPLDFEEALATYFSMHSINGSISTRDEDFHQGERSKYYVSMLNERYPNPQLLASVLKEFGMRGLLADNADLFDDNSNPKFTE